LRRACNHRHRVTIDETDCQGAPGQKKEDKQHSVAEICRIMGISKPTLYSYLEETNG
jgi:hypothetical protein